MKVKLINVRLAFANVFEAKAHAGGGEPTFSAAFPIEPGSANAQTIAEAVGAVAVEKWKDKAKAIIDELKSKDRMCYRTYGLSKDGTVYQGFEDMYSLSASNKVRPRLFNKDKSPIVREDGILYSGCFVNAIVDIWAQQNDFGRRINATLAGLQFVADGDRFGGGTVASEDDFDVLDDEGGATQTEAGFDVSSML